MRKFKLCICKKKKKIGAADVKLKKDMILAGELQFYQLQKRKNKKNSGSDGIWTQASQNITANWATEVNVNSSALMPIYFYRTLMRIKINKDMILASKLQFYQLQKSWLKKNSGSDEIRTQAITFQD